MHRIQLNENLSANFSSLLFEAHVDEHEEINPMLAEVLFDMRKASPQRSRTAAGAWQSASVLGGCGSPAVDILNRHIGGAVMTATATYFGNADDVEGSSVGGNMWGTIYENGDYAAPHAHSDAHWSGIYIVEAGDPPPSDPLGNPVKGERSGHIEFYDPGSARPGRGMGRFRWTEQNILIRPENGMLILFPSPLWHFVHPYVGTEKERITIAFNTWVEFQEVPG